jgi:hypothetical protein
VVDPSNTLKSRHTFTSCHNWLIKEPVIVV